MDHFRYVQGALYCEQVSMESISRSVGTPTYVYSSATLLAHYDRIVQAFSDLKPIICFSVKSCQNLSICRLLKDRGAGFDVVSGGELFRALQAGGDPKKIVYAGVGKTDREINEAIDAGIGWLNVESEAEMENLVRIARDRRREIQVALRVNPDVDPRTHVYTSTGKKESKFGVDLERARKFFKTYGRQPGVRLNGVHVHIGSPVNSIQPYVDAVTKVLRLIDELAGEGLKVEMMDIGGGFGAHYESNEAPTAADYAFAIVPLLRGRGLQVILEPGRSIAANAGVLLTQVLYIKQSGEKQFVIVDGAMNDLVRPALYGAYHFVWPTQVSEVHVPHNRGVAVDFPGTILADVVGPVCESGDFLAKERKIPPIQRGELLAIFSAGAYGFVMSSQYNSRPRAAEVLVQGSEYKIVRQRETYQDLVLAERV